MKKIFTFYILLVCTLCTSAQVTNGLVAYYPFNGNANDASGNGNNGSINGSVSLTTDRFGNSGKAYSFPGNTGSYIQVADNASLHPGSTSISVWANVASITSLATFVDKPIGSCINDSWHFGTQNSNFSAWVSNSFSCGDFLQQTSPFNTGAWRHIVFIIDTASDTRKLYVDGVNVATDAYTASIPYDASLMYIGAAIENGSLAFPLNGSLDDIRIYSRAITDAEVTTLFNEPNPNSTNNPLFGDAPQVVAAEYFIDTDPGTGNGNSIPVTNGDILNFTANIPTTLSTGFHFLAIRTKDASGNWGLFESRGFYVSSASVTEAANIVAAEYFYDTDPGPGNGDAISVTNGAIVNFNTSLPASLTPGFHFIAIRTKDATGNWGLFESRGFNVSEASVTEASDIVAAEYFYDTDPGPGNGLPITVTNGAIVNFTANVPANIPAGFHFIAIRTKDASGHWGLFESRGFYVSDASATEASNIVAAEYFFDADPGPGNGLSIAVTSGAIVNFSPTLPVSLSPGFHFIAIRTKDADGHWGLFEPRGFYINAANTNLPDIIAAEYFLDHDPGTGNGTPINIPAPGATISETFHLTMPFNLQQGHHELAIRVMNSNGQWSLYERDTFYLPVVTIPKVFIGTVAANFCAGDPVAVPYTVNLPFAAANQFTAQLSNASGSFTSPVNIGALQTSDSGTINAIIPVNTAAGSGYRIRVIASSPADTSNPNFSNITIGRKPDVSFTITGVAPTCVGVQNYSASATEAGATYAWTLSGGGTLTPSASSASINWTSTGTDTITLRASNSCGSGPTQQLIVNVFASAPTITPTISVVNRTLTAAAANIAQSVTGYQWFKDGVLMPGVITQSYTVPNTDSASYTVAYTNTCGTGPQSLPQIISIAKTDQTISFDVVPPKIFGDPAFPVNATATSGLPVVYNVISGPATISGNNITITGAGVIIVQATQAGNSVFNSATATLSITVNKAPATIVLSNLLHTYDGTGKTAIATTNPLGLNNIITYEGSNVLPLNAGRYATVATITSLNYAGTASDTLVIQKANQTISLQNIPDKSFNSAAFNVTTTASSGLPVTITIVTVPASGVASVSGNTITLLGAGGTVTVTANQAGNNNYNPATTVSTTFNVTPPLANDLQIVSIVNPAGGCGLGDTATVTIKLKNLGTVSASGFDVSYVINNGTVVTETFSGTLAAGQEQNHTFTTNGIFNTLNTIYSLKAYVTLAGDQRTSNDTLIKLVTRYAAFVHGVSADTTICSGTQTTLVAFGGGTYNWTGGPFTATNIVHPLIETTYQVAVTEVHGCSTANHSVTVHVNANPVASAGNDTSILRGSSAGLVAAGGTSYLWNTGDTTAAIAVSPVNTTSYIVTVSNASKCTAKDTVKVTVNFSALSVTPSVINFGSVVVDSSVFTNITIVNNGTITETISSLTGMGSPFTTSMTFPQTIAPGATLILPVKFNPTATLFYQAIASLNSSVGIFSLNLKGKGVVAAAAWSVTPAQYNYGNVTVGTFANKDFIIANTGNVSIKITTVSSSSPRFIGTVNGITTVPVGGSVVLSIRFNPTAVTAYSGSITIRTSTAGLGFLKPILSGNGFIVGAPPQLIFVSSAPFNDTSGVNPPIGPPGNYTYSIIYKHPSGVAPMTGFPKVGIDKNADGDYSDNGEGVFSMVKVDTGTNWTQGEMYTFVTSLPLGDFYGYQFFATDVLGNNSALFNYKSGPLVTRESLDLHIFADDIVFSNMHPAVNENFQVSATVHNNSPYSASDVEVRFYYKDSIYLFNDVIPFIDGHTTVTLTHTLNFSPDGFYPIKVWIDSSHALTEEYNVLNNYATRPVIVGNFTLPGTIDVTSTATPAGCNKGKVIFSGHANYRGLNLAEKPPVEGATVTITVLNYTPPRVLTLHTNTNGDYYIYDDPCAQDINPEDCLGYLCGVTYNYTVEVTDFTLTSPPLSGTVTRPCVNCNADGTIQHGAGVGCVLPNQEFDYNIFINNYSYDFSGHKICAPVIYNDTITVYLDGALAYTYTLDSISRCADIGYNSHFAGLPIGLHSLFYTHSYYTAGGVRQEVNVTTGLDIPAPRFDLHLEGINKTGRRSFTFEDVNLNGCGVIPGGFHKVYLYDSLAGYQEAVLIDSFMVNSIGNIFPANRVALGYSNPNWAVGLHYLTIITDATFLLPELDETNNILKALFLVEDPIPDITVMGIKFSSSTVVTGSLINFAATFKNEGADITQPFKVSFRANGALVGTPISIPSLMDGEQIEIFSSPFTIPTNPCPIQIIASADVDNQIQESKETNNYDTAMYGVNIKAGRTCDGEGETIGAGFFNSDDPFATFQCFAYEAPKGRLTYFATTVKNSGTRDASNIKVRFSLNGVILGTDVIPLLKAGTKVESGFFYTFDTVGRFIISAYADYTREICEIDESDNIGSIHVDTKPTSPDLEIYSQHIAPSNLNPDPGQTITVVSSILNVGDAVSKPCKVRFWVDNIQLGVDIPIDSIFPGQDTTVMATATYSSNIVGPKIIKVKADFFDEVLERQEGNNEATRSIIVGGAPDFANSLHEAITITPNIFAVGDSVTICNYIRNYGGDGGTAWLRFSYKGSDSVLHIIDSVLFTYEPNDSGQVCIRWRIPEFTGMIITEILHSFPPEFNELNNIDTLTFGATVPVTLISFNGVKNRSDVLLNWKTTSEQNLLRYEIERSKDAIRFLKIGEMPASNTGGLHSYNSTDINPWPANGNNLFYRLKIIDQDGKYRYSHIVNLNNKLFATLNVTPNPVKGLINIQMQAVENGLHIVKVFDAAGKLYLLERFNLLEGNQIIRINAERMAQGIYLLEIFYPDGKHDEVRFVKE